MASFVSVLKKIGTAIVDTAEVVTGVGPLLQNIIPASSKVAGAVSTATNDLTDVANIIATVEAAFAAVSSAPTGTLKLQAAAPLVSQVIQQSAILVGKKIANPTLFNQGVIDITNAVVEILNSVSPSGTQASNNGALPITTPASTVPSTLAVPAGAPTPTPTPAT